ncbi:MAG: ferrous iron transport protein A [Candidatus Hecatellales archaeon]|nr:MAG: ferrous iron transport protein A [Candidatus Hecatellales archaeon]
MIDLAKEFRLAEGAVGKTYEIIRLEGSGAVRRRIMDMGLLPKTRVKLVNVAPLGDPLDLEVKGFNLTIRKSEASTIIVREVGE